MMQQGTAGRLRLFLVMASVLLMLLVLGFGCLLNVASFKKSYLESMAAGYKVAALQGQRTIEYSVRYGKPLDNFQGMPEILSEIQSRIPGCSGVRVVLPDGSVPYRSGAQEKLKLERLPDALLPAALNSWAESGRDWARAAGDGEQHIFLPMKDKHGGMLGVLALSIADGVINEPVERFLWRLIAVMAALALPAAAAVALGVYGGAVVDRRGQVRKKRLVALFFFVFAMIQLVYGLYSSELFRATYGETMRQNTGIIARSIKDDVDTVLAKGISYNRLVGLDEYLQQIIAGVPELAGIAIVDNQGKIMYKTSDEQQPEATGSLRLELAADRAAMVCWLRLEASARYLEQRNRELLLDMGTVGLLAMFLMYELLNFLLLYVQRSQSPAAARTKNEDEETELLLLRLTRPVAFVLFIGVDLSLSFIPMCMKGLYAGEWGLPLKMAVGIPISLEMLCAGLSTFATGFLADWRGWRLPFRGGIALLAVGALLSGLAQGPLAFIAARGVVGLGYGLAWMALRTYIAKYPGGSGKAVGFAQFNAGVLAGSACGCALGGMLAERIGYAGAFFASLLLILIAGGLAIVLLQDQPEEKSSAGLPATVATVSPLSRLRMFFTDVRVPGSLLLYTIPSTICNVGFLNYFLPVYFGDMGISTANTGRVMILYGMCIIYIGPWAGQYLRQNRGERKFVLLAGLMVAGMLIAFSRQPGLEAALLAVLLLGIADSFGGLALNTYFVNLPATKTFGEGKALSIYGLSRKLGQAAGPLVFGGVFAAAGAGGLWLVGGVYLILLTLFAALAYARPLDL